MVFQKCYTLNMNKHNHDIRGFSVLELILVSFIVLLVGGVGSIVLKHTSKSGPGQTYNQKSAATLYATELLPYQSTQTKLDHLPTANQLTITTTKDAIHLSFKPNIAVGDIYTTKGTLIVDQKGSATTKTIQVDITEQLLAGTPAQMGLDIDIGNQFPHDDRLARVGNITPGQYKLEVRVHDTTGKELYTGQSSVTFP